MYNKQFVENDGYVYILHIIDLFSRYLWMFPLQDKEGKTIADCFNKLAKDGLKPQKLFVDKGSEFYNKYMNYYCEKYDVERYSVTTERKSSVAERNIRTIREILFKYFEKTGKQRWIHILDKVNNFYNNKTHSLLGLSPSEARDEDNFDHVFNIMNSRSDDWKKRIHNPVKFKVGDKVRIKINKNKFDKGSKPTFSKDIYTISKIAYDSVYYYRLEEISDRFFYEDY
jgi:predicted MPP superfamily phosphohydrolase